MTSTRAITDSTLPLSLLDSLQSLSQARFSGCLNIHAGAAVPWQCFFRFGRLVYVSGGANAQQRWKTHLLKACPMLDWHSFVKDFPTQSADAMWEYQTLCSMVTQGYLTTESAMEFVRDLMTEILSQAASARALRFELDTQHCLDAQFTLFSFRTVLENLRNYLKKVQVNWSLSRNLAYEVVGM